jgi:CRP-like cAMP-binding protein
MGLLGQPSPYRAQVRSTGLAYRIPSRKMQEIRDLCPVYLKGAYETSMHMLMQMSQNIACSKRHSIEQQLVRWMLTSLDKNLNKQIQITHQEISEILGFRREAITLNLAKLSSSNIVKIKRGRIEVIDRVMMEDRSCECYWKDQQIDHSFSRLTTSSNNPRSAHLQ